uniref:Uncharacterized protein n=1 Tax=Molossus molossus TaxID=27622 RepID=A0A7J8F9P4_MOLMO|nr:hypothetical protein HJG59_008583 [Molossus molossus]
MSGPTRVLGSLWTRGEDTWRLRAAPALLPLPAGCPGLCVHPPCPTPPPAPSPLPPQCWPSQGEGRCGPPSGVSVETAPAMLPVAWLRFLWRAESRTSTEGLSGLLIAESRLPVQRRLESACTQMPHTGRQWAGGLCKAVSLEGLLASGEAPPCYAPSFYPPRCSGLPTSCCSSLSGSISPFVGWGR